MTPWFGDRVHRFVRICRLGFHVAKSFFNPFGPRFLDPLAYELWLLIIHEQEVSTRMEETLAGASPPVNEFSFADDLMLSDSPDVVDDELEACLAATREHQDKLRNCTKKLAPKVKDFGT